MSYSIHPYDEALQLILDEGTEKSNKRTGIKTKYVSGICSRYDLTGSFPIVTRRKVWPRSIWAELLWFISGSTNNNDLNDLGANIWNPWVDSEFEKKHGYAPGSFGPVYGFQLRHFGGYYGNGIGGEKGTQLPYFKVEVPMEPPYEGMTIQEQSIYGKNGFDQLDWMVNRLKEDPSCRRILFSLWNPKDTANMKLPPCHYSFQVTVDDNGDMTGALTQRSCDFPIGVPANIQFYSALTMMLAQQTGFNAVEFVHFTVDSHIYWDQIEAVEEYLSLPTYDCPNLNLVQADDIYSYNLDNFRLSEYTCGPKLEIPVAV